MTRYTGGEVQSRDAVLALNLNGGGGMEIWQYTSREPLPAPFDVRLGDLGIFATRIKARDVQALHAEMVASEGSRIGQLGEDPTGMPHFLMKDPYGNRFDVVEGSGWFGKESAGTGGPSGCLIGVSDIGRALELYRDVLGYDTVLSDTTDVFDDWQQIDGGKGRYRRVLLAHTEERNGPFSRLFGPSRLELVKAMDEGGRPIFDNRFWGDLGFIHLCFDVRGMDALKRICERAGFAFTIDSRETFDMGEAGGRFAYIEDPDGTLVEFVETHRVPLLKKLGWYLNLEKRPPEKPLPDWMIKAFRFNRVR